MRIMFVTTCYAAGSRISPWAVAAVVLCSAVFGQEAAPAGAGMGGTADRISREDLAEIRRLREAAKKRPRRIWFNHDGCDASSHPKAALKGRKATPQDLLDLRTTPLADTQVDTLSYCTISSGFSNFTHRTQVGEVLTVAPAQEDRVNITQDLIDQGTDPLQVMVEFCHANDMECFWSMRMNDTHDAAWRPDTGHRLFPRLKAEHPEYLVGSYEDKPPYGTWSSVNYARAEIRELCYRFFEEVCRRYDVDGVEMDFFRHMCYFRSVAEGGVASEAELAMMTEMIRRIREMTEREGVRRGRPILVAVRVPDSLDYARGVGLDIERWLSAGLVDCVIGSGYFRFHHWSRLAELGERYGVQVYAGLSETRIRRDRDAYRARRSDESYRGRAMSAWQAGVDGIYIFNEYDARRSYLHDIGAAATMRGTSKLHFPTVRNGSPSRYLADGNRYVTRTILSPENTVPLTPGVPAEAVLEVGEDLSLAVPDGAEAEAICTVAVERLKPDEPLRVAINGHSLTAWEDTRGGRAYVVPPQILQAGLNTVEVELEAAAEERDTGAPSADESWDEVYPGTSVMKMPSQLPWRRLFHNTDWKEEVRDNALYLADFGRGPAEWANLVYPWSAAAGSMVVAQADVKVLHADAPLSVCMRVSNGRSVEILSLEPEKIGLQFAGLSTPMDTTDRFHTYRLAMRGDDIRLYVDGVLAIDGTGRFTTSALDRERWLAFSYGKQDWNARSFVFGSASGPGTGEALWRQIRLRDNTKTWADVSVRVSYPVLAAEVPQWDIQYDGNVLPAKPWHLEYRRASTAAEVADGCLRIADRGVEAGDYLYAQYPWNITPETGGTLEARVRLVSGWCSMRCDDGVHSERLEIHPDRIQLRGGRGPAYAMDTIGDFHVYRVVVERSDIRVYVDGKLRIDGAGLYVKPAANGRNDIGVGSANSPSLGEALWDYVRIARRAY